MSRSRIAWTALAIAMAASVALIGVEARHTAINGDEWDYAYRLASQPLFPAVFDSPQGKYLIALPMLIYAGLLETFGIASYLPYRIVGLGLLLAGDALFFELARRRVGPMAALPPAILLLFLGSASEVVVIPTRMPSQVALTAGLGMLIALERRDLRGDVIACVLLLLALVSHPLGLAFAAAALTSVALRPADERWRRWWIVVVPIALLALWWLTLHGSIPGATRPSFGQVISFAAKSFVAVCAAASGFFRAPWADGADFINGFSITLALLLVGAVVARLATLRPVPVTAWVAVAAFVAILVAPGLAPGGLNPLRKADAARYLYPNAVLLFLLCAELASGLRLRGGVKSAVAAGIAAVFAISLLSNVRLLVDRAQAYEQAASLTKSKLAGAELALTESRAQITVASAGVSDDLAGTQLAFVGLPWPLPAGALAAYYTVSDRFGTPAYSRDQLRQVSAPLQHLARLEFRSALKLNGQSGG